MEIKDTDQADPDATGTFNAEDIRREFARMPLPGQDFEARFGEVKLATEFKHGGDDVSNAQCS